jgi:hypothetical protein
MKALELVKQGHWRLKLTPFVLRDNACTHPCHPCSLPSSLGKWCKRGCGMLPFFRSYVFKNSPHVSVGYAVLFHVRGTAIAFPSTRRGVSGGPTSGATAVYAATTRSHGSLRSWDQQHATCFVKDVEIFSLPPTRSLAIASTRTSLVPT